MKQLFIEYQPYYTRTAYAVDGKLKEIYIDPTGETTRVGHIYVGRVKNILPGQFAFIDIGAERNAFVNLARNHTIKKGDPLLIQIYKEAYEDKGAYGGQQLKLKGRYVIIQDSHRGEIGVSSKITNPQTRALLRGAVYDVLREIHHQQGEKTYGAIVRTNAHECDEATIADEVRQLIQVHATIKKRAVFTRPPLLLYPTSQQEHLTWLNDFTTDDLDELWVASSTDTAPTIEAIKVQAPHLKNAIFTHDIEKSGDFFETFHFTHQIKRALQKKVNLPCGGYLTIEQTEACVVIDVNTGAYSGAQDFRAAIVRTNNEAAIAIAEQLTLRNLSGIVIIDFIDMKDQVDKKNLLHVLATAIKNDRIKTELVGMTELGLVQLTRRKTRPSLERMLQITAQTHTKTPK